MSSLASRYIWPALPVVAEENFRLQSTIVEKKNRRNNLRLSICAQNHLNNLHDWIQLLSFIYEPRYNFTYYSKCNRLHSKRMGVCSAYFFYLISMRLNVLVHHLFICIENLLMFSRLFFTSPFFFCSPAIRIEHTKLTSKIWTIHCRYLMHCLYFESTLQHCNIATLHVKSSNVKRVLVFFSFVFSCESI